MFMKGTESVEAWAKPGKAAFDLWVSFWPVAPLFGVEWRFAEAMPRFSPLILEGDDVSEPLRKPAKKAARQTLAAVSSAEPVAETPVPAPVEKAAKETVKQTVETVETAAEAATATVDTLPRMAEAAAPAQPASLLDKAPETADDLKLIKGVGPGLEKQLNGLGVYTFAQIAKFSEEDLAWVDEHLTSFKGRCFRDDWVAQAKALMA